MKSTLNAFSIAVIFCALMTSCTRPSDVSGSVFKFRLPSEAPTIMPIRGIDNVSIDIMNNILEGLFEFDADMKPQPKLCERFTVSPNGKTYRFYLRKNVLWSDDVPFRAQQIMDSWKMVLSSKSQAEYAYLLFPIVNAEKYHAGTLEDFSKVGVKVLNDFELEVTLDKALPYFTSLLSVVVTFPMRVDLYEKFGDAWTEPPHVASLASYVLTKWDHDRQMVFEANPRYWGKAPQVKTVVAQVIVDPSTSLNLFETGKLDLVRQLSLVDVARFLKDPRYFVTPYFRNTYLGFQMGDARVRDVKVREALVAALDRTALVKILNAGQTETSSFIPEGMLGFDSSVGIKYDPAVAKKLWAESLRAAKPTSTHFQLYYDQRGDNKTLMEAIQHQWREVLGITVELQPVEWKVYISRLRTGIGPIFRYGWGADFPDPDNFMTVFLSGSGNNHVGFKNARYDELVLSAQHEQVRAKRAELYLQAQKILLEKEIAIVPLFNEGLNYVLQPKWRPIHFDRMTNLFFNRLEPAAKP